MLLCLLLSDIWFNLGKVPTELGKEGRNFSIIVRKKKIILYFSADTFQPKDMIFFHYYYCGKVEIPKTVLL